MAKARWPEKSHRNERVVLTQRVTRLWCCNVSGTIPLPWHVTAKQFFFCFWTVSHAWGTRHGNRWLEQMTRVTCMSVGIWCTLHSFFRSFHCAVITWHLEQEGPSLSVAISWQRRLSSFCLVYLWVCVWAYICLCKCMHIHLTLNCLHRLIIKIPILNYGLSA